MHYLIALIALVFEFSVLAQGLKLAGEGTPFENSATNLYSMTKEQLLKVPPGQILQEIKKLEARNAAESADLANIKAFNSAMCKRLERLKNECVAQHFVDPENGLGGLNCGGSQFGASESYQFQVEVLGSQGKSFRLVANSQYITNMFANSTTDPIRFRRGDNRIVKSPRFRELTSLNLVCVKGTSKVQGSIITGRTSCPKGVRLRISINGKELISEPNLLAHSDSDKKSELRVDPRSLIELGQATECNVSVRELNEMEQASRVR